MNIRRAEEKDYKELMPLYNGLVGEDRYSRHDNDSFATVLKNPNSFIFVAEDGGRIIGFATCSIRTIVRYPKPIAELDELFVLEEYRNRGIGKQLVEKIEEISQENNCYRVYIASAARFPEAHEFYINLGYDKYGFHFHKNL